MADDTTEDEDIHGELARVMRAVQWFLAFPLVLPFARLLRSQPLPPRLDGLEITVWILTAAAFYSGFRGRPRDPHTWAAASVFSVLGVAALARIGASVQALALVPFVCAVLAVLLVPPRAQQPASDDQLLDPGHPLATVAMLERHAAEMEAEGRAGEAQKLRERAERIRRKSGGPRGAQ